MSSGVRTIAHVFATFGAGGPQVRAAQLMAHLGRGSRHVVMAMDGRTDAMAHVSSELDVTTVPPPARAGFLATAAAQRRWLEGLEPDLVLTYNWGAIESVAAAKKAGLPLVHHEDGFGPEEIERRYRRRNWTRRLVLKSVPVIVPSTVLEGIAQSEWRVPESLVHAFPNGVDLERFAAPVRAGHDDVTIGTVGGLRGEKDHATLLRAFAGLTGNGRLRIVGGGGLEASLRALAAELGLAERTDFVGAVADTAPEYARMDVFVLSSRTEQMPIALLEAMASGCAVVATDVGDVRKILPAAQLPFVVERENPQALAAALGEVMASSSLRQELGTANRAIAEERYEARQCLARFAAVYDRVAAATSRRRT